MEFNYEKKIERFCLPPGYGMAVRFFTILHNYLVIEHMFPDEGANVGIMLNEFLHIVWEDNPDEIIKIFERLYDPTHIIRNNLEKFNQIPVIGEFINSNYDLILSSPLEEEDFAASKFGI